MAISGPAQGDAQLIGRARAAFGAGQHALALQLARQIPANGAAALDALEVMALAHRALGDVAGTERLLRRAIDMAPARHWPRDDLARLLLETGRADAAERVCREAVAADPGNANVLVLFGFFLSEREVLVAGVVLLCLAFVLAGSLPLLLVFL